MRGNSRRIATIVFLAALMSLTALPAWAHPHRIDTNHDGVITEADVKLANGQNHGPYVIVDTNGDGVLDAADGRQSCGGDPAAYGLETAHHGPDAGTPGKSDGCYLTDAGGPGVDVANPVIR